MGRPIRNAAEFALSPEVEALDPVRRRWYRGYIGNGLTHAEALRKAKAHVPARERFRAIDPELAKGRGAD